MSEHANKFDLGEIGKTTRPRDAIHALGKASELTDTDQFMSDLTLARKMETHRKSKASVASGLRTWHFFALVELGYSFFIICVSFLTLVH